MRNSVRLLAGSGFLAAALVGAVSPAQAYPTVPPTVLSSGHVDAIDVEYEDGELELAVHDEEPDTEYAPSDVLLLVKKSAKTTVPADANYTFLGAPGDKVWILPEIQNTDLLWAGLSTEELEAGVFVDDSITIDIEGVRGPGDLAVFTSDAVGTPNVLVDSEDGLPDTITLTAGAHQHVNWAFDRPGTYQLTVSASATLADSGETVTSEPAVYTFKVQK